jgi:hypothetical protein
MSAESAKAVVRRNTEEVQNQGNFDVFEELFADDFVDHTPQPDTTPDKAGVRKLYSYIRLLEWIDPPFCSGHWSPELVRLAGGVEGIGQEGRPSRMTAWDEIITFDPEVMVIACCGFTTKRTLQDLPILHGYPHFKELACVREAKVFVVDGNAYFSRPGPRLVDSLEILGHALHPNLFALPAGLPEPHRLTAEELGLAEHLGA